MRTPADASPLEQLSLGLKVREAQFDSIYPPHIRKLSERFWTPVAVAKEAAAFLVRRPGDRVLDAGSGVGKFCLVGSCTTSGSFEGLEQRLDLVKLSRVVAQALGAPPTFHHGNLIDLDWSSYQSIYLYNPFFELTSGPWCQIDASLSHSPETRKRYVQAVTETLDGLTAGTRVATYFGFGGTMPRSFSLLSTTHEHAGPLEFWVKSH